METTGITIWYSVPTALVQLLRHGVLERRNLDALRLILFAGEAFPVPDLSKLMESLPNCEFINLYGPTETNVCTYYRVPAPPQAGTKDIPIGVTCENLQAGLYQEDDTETPDGEVGELVVFGPSVMLGYLNQAKLTEKSRLKGNTKSYRTGDFAYKDSNNLYRLVGRKDDQIKIRGHRFELMEVTSVLILHPAIVEATALLSEPPDGEAEIIAFVVPEANAPITTESVQAHCGNFIPRYAVPKRVLILDKLPRTATGKIDRQKLRQHQNF